MKCRVNDINEKQFFRSNIRSESMQLNVKMTAHLAVHSVQNTELSKG